MNKKTSKKAVFMTFCVILIVIFSYSSFALMKGCGTKSLIYTGKFKITHNVFSKVGGCSFGVDERMESKEWDFSLPNCLPTDADAIVVKKCVDLEDAHSTIEEYVLNDKEKEGLSEAKWAAKKDNTFLIKSDLGSVDEDELLNILTCPSIQDVADIEFMDYVDDAFGSVSGYDYLGAWISKKCGFYSEYYCLLEVKAPSGSISFPGTTGGSTGGVWTGTEADFTKDNLAAGNFMLEGGNKGGNSYSAGSTNANPASFTTDGSVSSNMTGNFSIGSSRNKTRSSVGNESSNLSGDYEDDEPESPGLLEKYLKKQSLKNDTESFCDNGDCCVDGNIAKSDVLCYSNFTYGCRDSAFFPAFSDSAKMINDNGKTIPNKDVYSRTVKRYCSGSSSDCDGNVIEEINNYKLCSKGYTCSLGNNDCENEKVSNSCIASSVCYDASQYMWSGKTCAHTCSNSCQFSYTGETKCPAPSSISGKRMSGINYDSYCLSSDYCYYDVSCTSTGIIEGKKGEACLDQGKHLGNVCFKEKIIGNECSNKGVCNSKDEFLGTCSIGDFSSGYCLTGSTCYYGISCGSDGWKYKESEGLLDASGLKEVDCDSNCMNNGFVLNNANNMCYYNIRCDKDKGFLFDKEYCHPNGINGSICWTNYGCSISGCTNEALPTSRC